MRNFTSILCALLGVLIGETFASSTLALTVDSAAAGPGKFAGEEIRREAAARGMTIASGVVPAAAVRIALVLAPAGGPPAVAQSYGIRVENGNGRRNLTVRGADAAGVMYGGLEVAEAIHTGMVPGFQSRARRTSASASAVCLGAGSARETPGQGKYHCLKG